MALHRFERAGDVPALIADGLVSIDASSVDTDFLGHSYFAETTALIHDLNQLIVLNVPVNERGLGRLAIGATGEVWHFGK